jgi:hypothetical protein
MNVTFHVVTELSHICYMQRQCVGEAWHSSQPGAGGGPPGPGPGGLPLALRSREGLGLTGEHTAGVWPPDREERCQFETSDRAR